jgi:ATP-dependent Zn protease
VDDAIRVVVMRGYETARELLERERSAVEALARELLEHESVDAARAAEILQHTA